MKSMREVSLSRVNDTSVFLSTLPLTNPTSVTMVILTLLRTKGSAICFMVMKAVLRRLNTNTARRA